MCINFFILVFGNLLIISSKSCSNPNLEGYLLIWYILKEIGEREGKFYAINVPLKDGIDDTSFTRLFKTVSCGNQPKFMIDVIYLFIFMIKLCRV